MNGFAYTAEHMLDCLKSWREHNGPGHDRTWLAMAEQAVRILVKKPL